jgi:Domain of unknown function (DUF4360)
MTSQLIGKFPAAAFLMGLMTYSPVSLAEPPAELSSLHFHGSGCPSDSIAHLYSDDRTVLELLFDRMQVNLQPVTMGPAPYPNTKDCSINVALLLQPQFSVQWYRTEHRGFADTTGGGNGRLDFRYRLVGPGAVDRTMNRLFPVAWVGNFTEVHDLTSPWSPCNAPGIALKLDINMRLQGSASGYNAMTLDAASQAAKALLKFRFQRC